MAPEFSKKEEGLINEEDIAGLSEATMTQIARYKKFREQDF
jgi:hypothetical protein